jgi:DnaK suppressor protein
LDQSSLKEMDQIKIEHFRRLLLTELRRHARLVGDDQAAAIDAADDGAKESADLSLRDVIEELALRLGERESQMVADIDQALMRLEEGSYGLCVRCGQAIDERRLEAVPTARHDAACQAAIEQANGENARPTL